MNKTLLFTLAITLLATSSFASDRSRDLRLQRSPTYMGTTGTQIMNDWRNTREMCRSEVDCRRKGQPLDTINSFTRGYREDVFSYPKKGYVLDSKRGGYVRAPGAAHHE